MNYALILITVFIAGLGWLRPDATPSWWIPAAIGLLVISGAIQLRIERKERKTAAAGKFSGILRRRKRLLLSQRKGRLPQLEFGDSGAILQYSGPQGKPLFQIFDDTHLTIETEGNCVKVSTLIRDQNGNVVAELVRNEWRVNENTAFDRNYSADALEVRDATGDVVLQIRVIEDRVQFAGKFYDQRGSGVAFGKVTDPSGNEGGCIEFTGPARRQLALKIPPLFKYPSDQHLGELA